MTETFLMPIESLEDNQILVIPTNIEGNHNRGIAEQALICFDAKQGQAYGKQGKCYGIVMLDLPIETNPINYIKAQIKILYSHALADKDNTYLVALSGSIKNTKEITNMELARLFITAAVEWCGQIPNNIFFEYRFQELINIV